MDEVRTSPLRKRKLDDDEGRNMGNYSRLCDLPDAVLHQILWLLPTKDAIRMSMASKRWESLWRSFPKLDFCEKQFPERKIFKNFVQRTLHLRDRHSPVEAFSLSCRVSRDSAPDIKEWIAFALNHNVQELHLSLVYIFLLPSSDFGFRSETLRKLHLGGTYNYNVLLHIPHQVYLPSLKDLTLERVRLVDDESVWNLLSSPSLEKLCLDHCSCRPLKAVMVSAPLLHTFSIRSTMKLAVNSCYGLVMGADIVIQAPNLKHFRYEGELSRTKFVIPGSPLLAKAELCIGRTSSLGSPACRCKYLYGLLSDISRAKNLTLSIDFLEDLKLQGAPFDKIPLLSNLIKLKLVHGRTNLVLKSFSSLLRRCPSLRTLEFNSKCYLYYSPLREDQDSISPSFFLPNLEKITMSCFTASSSELVALQKLLLDAPMLEELVLHCDRNVLKEEDQLDRNYFDDLPRASKSCKIHIRMG